VPPDKKKIKRIVIKKQNQIEKLKPVMIKSKSFTGDSNKGSDVHPESEGKDLNRSNISAVHKKDSGDYSELKVEVY